MNLFDEIFGNGNWQRTHEVINGNLFCNIDIWDNDKKCWVRKQDVGDVICVSDAYTHIERLVFAGVEYMDKGSVCYTRYSTVIDGKNTFLIDGGSYDSVYEPCVYIRHLARLNGFKYGGIIKE